ncbi:hypothetical protein DFH09DRAFT_1160828 [Mycena vulgaris]|nr:hypothetical protein DFH09DRAFT_1160828 [Mycena vulgaris]
MPSKRKEISEDSQEVDDILDEVGLTVDILKMLQAHPEATKVVAELANRIGISDNSMKRARRNLPSFSRITGKEVASYFTLNLTFVGLRLDRNPNLVACLLPPSFHRQLYSQAWSAMDVYAEPTDHSLEAPRVRLLDSFLIPIFALFAGRVVDLPERVMPRTTLSSGGSVEHELFVIGNVLFFVIELKKLLDSTDNYAQLFAELYSASELNDATGFRTLMVYGLLTDMGTFEFFSFEPISKTFYQEEVLSVPRKREGILCDMIEVTNEIFSVVLQAFIDTLKVTCEKSKERSTAVAQLQQTPSIPPPSAKAKGRPSLGAWEKARDHALEAQAKLMLFDNDIAMLETTAKDGLKLLEKSVVSVQRITRTSSRHDLPSEEQMQSMAQSAILTWHSSKCTEIALELAQSDESL